MRPVTVVAIHDQRDQRAGTQHEAQSVKGKRTHIAHSRPLCDKGAAPDRRGQQKEPVGS